VFADARALVEVLIAGEAIGQAIGLVIGEWRNSLSFWELPFSM